MGKQSFTSPKANFIDHGRVITVEIVANTCAGTLR